MLKKYQYIALLGLSLSACTEDIMDDINKDTHHPPVDEVDAKLQISDAITSTAYSTLGGAYSWYVSSYTEQIFGTGNNQLAKAELRNRTETAASSTFNNEWNATYSNLLNIKQAIDKTADGKVSAGQLDVKGIAQVLWVIDFETLTDLHGDIPYSEALQGLSNTQPKLDKQEAIYSDLLAVIDDAITNLNTAISKKMSNVGNYDLIYGGKLKSWVGLAYAVKARLLLNTLYRNSSVLPQVVTAANNAIANGFDGAQLAIFNGISADNSWAAFNWSRYYSGACQTVANLFIARNDPRNDIYSNNDYWAYAYGSDYDGPANAPAGSEEYADATEWVGYPTWLDNGSATIHLFSKSELYFILAEAQSRLGQDPSAAFATAVAASFDDYATAGDWGYDDSFSVDSYIAALGKVTLDEIMVQKYLAQVRDEQLQTYNDIRRCTALGETHVKLLNPHNTSGGKNQWPLRLPYGNSDVISNPNIASAFGSGNTAGDYIFTENIWLFGGSR